jgi:hypothetical protein
LCEGLCCLSRTIQIGSAHICDDGRLDLAPPLHANHGRYGLCHADAGRLLQPFDAVVWIDPQEVEDEAIFGFAVPIALSSDVGCPYLRENSLGGVSAHELSIERRSAAFLVIKPRRENLVKLREGFVGQKAESVPVDSEDVVVDVGMCDLFEEERGRSSCVQLIEAQERYIA